MIDTTVYKKDSAGKLRSLRIYTNGADLYSEGGLVDGAKVLHSKTCKGKNLGRSNETSAEEQAEREAISKIAEKLKAEYFATPEEANTAQFYDVMTAKDFAKYKSKVKYPVVIDPKLDGMRCKAILNFRLNSVILESREFRLIDTVPHIENDLLLLMAEQRDFLLQHVDVHNVIVLDGELYVHGEAFQDIMSMVKNGHLDVTYHIYDMISDKSHLQRKRLLEDLNLEQYKHLSDVAYGVCEEEKLIDFIHKTHIDAGYEGSMIRWGNKSYEQKRSQHLLKYKDFIDIAAEILDIEPMDARPDHGIFVCRYDGKVFKATPKMSHEARIAILSKKDLLIGKMAEVRFFEYTNDGIPRFPVCVGIRSDK